MSIKPLSHEQLATSLVELLRDEPLVEMPEYPDDPFSLGERDIERLVKLIVPWVHREIVAEIDFLAGALEQLEDVGEVARARRVVAQDAERAHIVSVMRLASLFHAEEPEGGGGHAAHGA